eukprot:584676-Prorocentrum_minimum.AAC.2
MSSTQVTYFNAVLPPEASHGGMNMVKGSKRCEGVCLTCDGLIRGLRGYFRSSLPLTNKLLDAFLSRIRLCPHLQGNRTGLKGKRKPYHITRAIASTGKLEEEAVATEAPTLGKTSRKARPSQPLATGFVCLPFGTPLVVPPKKSRSSPACDGGGKAYNTAAAAAVLTNWDISARRVRTGGVTQPCASAQ